MASDVSGNVTMQKVYEYFQQQVKDSVDALNTELDKVGSGSSSSPSSSSSGTDSTSGTGSTSSAGGTSAGNSVSGDPVESGKVSYLFQMLSVAMTASSSTVKSIKDSLSAVLGSIR